MSNRIGDDRALTNCEDEERRSEQGDSGQETSDRRRSAAASRLAAAEATTSATTYAPALQQYYQQFYQQQQQLQVQVQPTEPGKDATAVEHEERSATFFNQASPSVAVNMNAVDINGLRGARGKLISAFGVGAGAACWTWIGNVDRDAARRSQGLSRLSYAKKAKKGLEASIMLKRLP